MRRLFRTTWLVAAGMAAVIVMMTCCTRQKAADGDDVPYTVAHNYFFNNNAQIPDNPKITSQADFNRLFGMAAVMGKDGTPTQIDFSRQFVIAVVLPATDVDTQVELGKLTATSDRLTLSYTLKTGARQTYFIQPMELIVVNKKYDRDTVVLLQR